MALYPSVVPDLERFAPYYRAPMLMLGATGSELPEFPTARAFFGRWVGGGYKDLDLDGGGLRLDLNKDLRVLSQGFQTVFNLGTLEHVWNAHNAWANALRAVTVGRYFLTHSPVYGYRDHGLHITSAPAIRAFIAKNGFAVLDEWTTRREVGKIYWLAAIKNRHIEHLEDFEPAWQVYEAGQKKTVS